MAGKFHSVFSLLKGKISLVICVKCSCHFKSLYESDQINGRFTKEYWKSLPQKSSKNQKNFQTFFRVDIHRILSPSINKWLSIKNYVDKVLEQYEPLKAYLFEGPSHTTQISMNNKFTKAYLEFMRYTLGLMT